MSDDLHSLSGAYALDALTDEERADFEIHLDRCPTCRDEVASLREVAPLLAETVATAPPASLRSNVLTRARETRQYPPRVALGEPHTEGEAVTSAPVIPLRRRRGWVALAAAAALVVGGGVTWQVVDEVTTSASEEVAGPTTPAPGRPRPPTAQRSPSPAARRGARPCSASRASTTRARAVPTRPGCRTARGGWLPPD